MERERNIFENKQEDTPNYLDEVTQLSPLTPGALIAHGFTEQEVISITQLKEDYDPIYEYFTTEVELNNLLFLKYLLENGEINELSDNPA